MAYVVSCPCGVKIREKDVERFVQAVQKHGQEVLKQKATREEILAMARKD